MTARPADADPLAAMVRGALADLDATGASLCVAFSGGRDSSVLLDVLAGLAAAPRVRALHVHHGLHPDADRWAAHCEAWCAARGVACEVRRVEVAPRDGESTEMAARRARHAAFVAALAPDECLLTAHHADDQLETLLMRLCRGSGTDGLAGMRASRKLGAGRLLRPLLAVPGEMLAAYARQSGLSWLEDPANADPVHDRSWLRAEVLPRLLQRWPHAPAAAARSARWLAEGSTLLAALAAIDAGAPLADGALSRARLAALAPERARNVLRHALFARGLPVPSAARLGEMLRQCTTAAPDAMPAFDWPGAALRVDASHVYLMPPLPEVPAGGPWPLRASAPHVDALGELTLQRVTDGPALADAWVRRGLALRYAEGGERLRAEGERHTRALTRHAAALGLPPWLRGRVPLLWADDRLVAICAGAGRVVYAAGCTASQGWRPSWTPSAALRLAGLPDPQGPGCGNL